MKRLKICHISCPNVHTAKKIKWLANKGHKNYLIASGEVEPIDGVDIYHIRWDHWFNDHRPRWERFKDLSFHSEKIRSLKPFLEMRKIVNSIAPDVVHSQTLKFPGFLGNYLNFHPYVVTPVNGDVLCVNGKMASNWQKLHNKIGMRMADSVPVKSKEMLKACIDFGANPKKTRIIYQPGVTAPFFSTIDNKKTACTKLGLIPSKIVLSPRNMEDLYNIDIIIKAIPLVAKEVDNITFVFIWVSGSQRDNLKKLAHDLRVWEKVRFVGTVPYEQVSLYHKAADVIISIPSSDNCPNTLLEAMASGRAFVAGDLNSVREWVKPGWNGILVNQNNPEAVAEAIIELIKNDTKRTLFAERNYNLIRERGGQDKEMSKMEELYYSLL